MIEMRHSTRVTKGDVREHWREKVAEAAIAESIMFFALCMMAIPTIAFASWRLLLVCAFIVVCQTALFARVAYCFIKYRKV